MANRRGSVCEYTSRHIARDAWSALAKRRCCGMELRCRVGSALVFRSVET
jgi:hypothetical protein